MNKELKITIFFLFLIDSTLFWLIVNIIDGATHNHLVVYGTMYTCFILSLYAFRSYDLLRLINLNDSIIGTLEGIFAGIIVTSAINHIPFLNIPMEHFLMISLLVILFFPIIRYFTWRYIEEHIEPIPVIFIGERNKWLPSLAELSQALNNKIMPVDFCKPDIESLNRCLQKNQDVKHVLIAESSFLDQPMVRRHCNFLRDNGITFDFFPAIIERYLGKVSLEAAKEFSSYYEIALKQLSPDPFKRALDILLAVSAFVVFSPVMAIVGIVIILSSGFPAIFRQQRVGFEGKVFTIHKFRTMKNGSFNDGPHFAREETSRITKLGSFLRKTHLDELPQLWDVLTGNMSLIAPRPEQVPFVKDFSDKLAFYNYRHQFRPGITGWAQINYKYASTIEETRIKLEYDLYYVKNRTLMLDLKIILKTIETVLKLKPKSDIQPENEITAMDEKDGN